MRSTECPSSYYYYYYLFFYFFYIIIIIIIITITNVEYLYSVVAAAVSCATVTALVGCC